MNLQKFSGILKKNTCAYIIYNHSSKYLDSFCVAWLDGLQK